VNVVTILVENLVLNVALFLTNCLGKLEHMNIQIYVNVGYLFLLKEFELCPFIVSKIEKFTDRINLTYQLGGSSSSVNILLASIFTCLAQRLVLILFVIFWLTHISDLSKNYFQIYEEISLSPIVPLVSFPLFILLENELQILTSFKACQCFNHASQCVYDAEVERQRLSVTPEGIYEGGGRCLDCQVFKIQKFF